jgi:hypothetical protein
MNHSLAEKSWAGADRKAIPSRLTLLKRPLGRILVDGKFIPEAKLHDALAEQHRTNELLGEILVRFGEIESTDLQVVLSFQEDLADGARAAQLAAGVRKMLGEILVQAQRISPEQLDAALAEQRESGAKLGEILVKRGLLNRRELDAALMVQQHRTTPPPLANRLKLGEVLIAAGYITRPQLEEALDRQRHSQQRLGELLVAAGHAQPRQIEHGIRLQSMLLAAALTAALSLFAPAPSVEASTVQEASASARVMVSAVIPARASINVIRQVPTIVVTDADVQRGFVEVADATLIELKNNSSHGCLLIFETHDLPFREATVNILGREVAIGPGGGMLAHQGLGTVALPLSYRFALNDNMQPGTYAWPFTLNARTL